MLIHILWANNLCWIRRWSQYKTSNKEAAKPKATQFINTVQLHCCGCVPIQQAISYFSPPLPPPLKSVQDKAPAFHSKTPSDNRSAVPAHLSWCIIKLIASNRTAFFAFECCTFFDFGGSCALLRMVSRHSVRRPRTAGSSGEQQAVGQLRFAPSPNPYLRYSPG